MNRKSIWIGDRTLPKDGQRYKATVYDVWNCVKLGEEIVSPDVRIPSDDWRVIKLERI